MLAEIRDRLSIAELIGRDLPLRKAGRVLQGLCPFHNEKGPSFTVTEARKSYHCFGCGAHGDIIRWFTEFHGLSFQDAVRRLGAIAGVEVPEGRQETDAERQARLAAESVRARLLRVNDQVASFFSATLAGANGTRARQYLAGRAITAAEVERFRLGCCPDPVAFDRWVTGAGIDPADIVALGLVSEPEDGWRDGAPLGGGRLRFRDRLIFPILDASGEVQGFTGRALGDAPAKYLNSPESAVFEKGATLYGVHVSKAAARRAGRLLLVEGNVDTIVACRQIPAVAPMGTALTEAQVRQIARLADRVVVCMDGDAAGRKAAVAHCGPLLSAGLDARVVCLPPEVDPDKFVRAGGDLAAAADEAGSLLGWVIKVTAEGIESPEQAAEAAARLRALIGLVREEVARDLYAEAAGAALGIAADYLLPEAPAGRPPRARPPATLSPVAKHRGAFSLRRSTIAERAMRTIEARDLDARPSEEWAAEVEPDVAAAVARELFSRELAR